MDPGRLSREWSFGRRKSYVAPLPLFLASMFLLFLVPLLTGKHLLSSEQLAPLISGVEGLHADPVQFGQRIEARAYTLAFLLPLFSAVILRLLMFRRAEFPFHDHLVVSLYGLSFAALMASLAWALVDVVTQAVHWLILGILALHAVAHLKGAYGIGWVSAAIRAAGLSGLSYGAFLLFVIIVTAVATVSELNTSGT